MIVQFEGRQPPRGIEIPELDGTFPLLPESKAVTVPSTTITAGIDDDESLDQDQTVFIRDATIFGWDLEKPPRIMSVDQFEIQERPVTNAEYLAFWNANGRQDTLLPASWKRDSRDQLFIKTVFGDVPFNQGRNWVVYASGEMAQAYAEYHGLRLPTESELYLVKETEERKGHDFETWLPECGWEWTSTVLEKNDGFAESELYKGYSSDFWYAPFSRFPIYSTGMRSTLSFSAGHSQP